MQAESNAHRGLKILLAEDDALIALDLAMTLRDAGWCVLGPSASVAATIELIRAERPDVALLDVKLMDGVATPVAVDLTRAGVPFALLTGTDTCALDAPLLAAPRLAKPFAADDILQVVEGLLARLNPLTEPVLGGEEGRDSPISAQPHIPLPK